MAVEIKRERADLRRFLWVDAPIDVLVQGETVRARQWCLGGVRLPGLPGNAAVDGQQIALRLTLPFQGFDIGVGVTAEVDAVSDDGQVVLRFLDLGARERELLSHFVDELVRGSMVPVADTIRRIDVPVLPTRLTPDIEAGAPSRWRRRLASLVRGTVYVALGVAGLALAGTTLYYNLVWREIETAFVSAPTATLTVPGSGRLKWNEAKPGLAVKAGDMIATVTDTTLERQIRQAEIDVIEREARADFIRKKLINERSRLGGLAVLSQTAVDQATLEIDALSSQKQALEREIRQQPTRATPASAREQGEARRKLIAITQKIEARRLDLALRRKIGSDNEGRREMVGKDLTGNVDDLEAQLLLAEAEVEIAEMRRDALVSERSQLAITAPFAGRLVQLTPMDDGSVARGDAVALVEHEGGRGVTALVKEELVRGIGVGDAALVQLASGRTLPARVVRVDHATDVAAEQERRTDTARRGYGATVPGARVALAFDNSPGVDTEMLVAGEPAFVLLKRRNLLGERLGRVLRAMRDQMFAKGKALPGAEAVAGRASAAMVPLDRVSSPHLR